MTQRDENPYRYSDSNKRYMTYDWYLKHRFWQKTARAPLDAGCTCPNLDGRRGVGGCIYCAGGSSSAHGVTIREQYDAARAVMERKWGEVALIPYFQANTNTYGDMKRMRGLFLEAAGFEGAVMLSIATRADSDCVTDEVTEILAECAERIPLTVEVGLQTSSDETARRINRCHTYAEFLEGWEKLRKTADEVNRRYDAGGGILPMKRMTLGIHVINGLPGEGRREMMKTALDVASLSPDMVKIHLLHVMRSTALEGLYAHGGYEPMTEEDYVSVVCDQLEVLPPETVIGRLTGDGNADSLIAPLWSRRKTAVINDIDKELYRRGSYQGMRYASAANTISF